MTLGQFTEPKLLVPRLLSDRQESVITELSQRLENAARIENAPAFTRAVLEHESLASAVFDGVAFPLARGRAVNRLSFAIGLAQQSMRWGIGNAPRVHTVFLFAVPLSEGQHYLSLVQTISSFTRDEMAFSTLRRCTQPEAMLGVLNAVRVVRMGHSQANVSGALAGRET
jgi:PTS system fructose-specific IIA component